MTDLSQRRRGYPEPRAPARPRVLHHAASVDDLLGTIEGQRGAEVDMIRSILANNLSQQRTHVRLLIAGLGRLREDRCPPPLAVRMAVGSSLLR